MGRRPPNFQRKASPCCWIARGALLVSLCFVLRVTARSAAYAEESAPVFLIGSGRFVDHYAGRGCHARALRTRCWHEASVSRVAVAATTTAAVDSVGSPFISAKKGRAGGGGDGDEPTPLEKLQVAIYRWGLFFCALSWSAVFVFDFLMTNDVNAVDGTVQTAALQVADVSAGIAACAVPTGSLVAAGVLLKICGAAAIAARGLEAFGFSALVGAAGPACLLLICAREVFWFGIAYRTGTALAVLVFGAILAFRISPETVVGSDWVEPDVPVESSRMEEDLEGEAFLGKAEEPKLLTAVETLPVGPPVPLSFFASTGLSILALSKIFEPVGEDLDEEGEKGFKRSSRSLYESGFPDFRPSIPWLPPAGRKQPSDADETAATNGSVAESDQADPVSK